MRKISYRHSLILIATLLLTACGKTLKQEIDSRAIDNEISEKDFNELIYFVADDSKYAKYQQPVALHDYILKVVESSKNSITVWNPSPPVSAVNYDADVYLENSYSMDGYMAETDLKTDVYELLTHLHAYTRHLRLNYISGTTTNAYPDATNADCKEFILNLNGKTFQAKAGKRGISDMGDIISRVLDKTSKGNLSVLISDFVFSPGSGINAAKYLREQQISIESAIAEKLLKDRQLAIVIYQMNASFSGDYFDLNNKAVKLTTKRPYYIWLIGDDQKIVKLLAEQVIKNDNRNLLNRAAFKSTLSEESLDYKIVLNDKIGSFAKTSQRNEIISASDRGGVFAFSVAVNFANNIKGNDYFLDASHYWLSDLDYSVTPRLLSDSERKQPDLSGYTHLLTFKTKRVTNKTIELKIISDVPKWAVTSHSEDDSGIGIDRAEQGKTFGLNYLITGLNQGFNAHPNKTDNVISTLKITISK